MSFKMMRLAKQVKGLSRSEKLVLVTLADYYNEGEGRAWPSHETMAQDLHYERTTVIRACKGLLKKGLISWYKEMGPNGRFSSNRYKLHLVEFCHTAKSQDTVLQDSTSPCGEVQQKPLIEPLDITISKSRCKKPNVKKALTVKQKAFATNLALKYYDQYKEEHYSFELILRDVETYLLTAQGDQDWRKLGNGLPPPSAFK